MSLLSMGLDTTQEDYIVAAVAVLTDGHDNVLTDGHDTTGLYGLMKASCTGSTVRSTCNHYTVCTNRNI